MKVWLASTYALDSLNNEPFLKMVVHAATLQENKCAIIFQSTVTGVHGANGEPALRRVARQATQGYVSERGSATVLNPHRKEWHVKETRNRQTAAPLYLASITLVVLHILHTYNISLH